MNRRMPDYPIVIWCSLGYSPATKLHEYLIRHPNGDFGFMPSADPLCIGDTIHFANPLEHEFCDFHNRVYQKDGEFIERDNFR